MQKELELLLRNKNIVNQNNALLEKNPRRFMRQGIWVTEYTVHIYNTIAGLSLRGKITHYENGTVEKNLVFSTYGDLRISDEEISRREKVINHIKKYGAMYQEEPPIKWFN